MKFNFKMYKTETADKNRQHNVLSGFLWPVIVGKKTKQNKNRKPQEYTMYIANKQLLHFAAIFISSPVIFCPIALINFHLTIHPSGPTSTTAAAAAADKEYLSLTLFSSPGAHPVPFTPAAAHRPLPSSTPHLFPNYHILTLTTLRLYNT